MRTLNKIAVLAVAMSVFVTMNCGLANPSYAQDPALTGKQTECQMLGLAVQKLNMQEPPKNATETAAFLTSVAKGITDVKVTDASLKPLQLGYATAIQDLATSIKEIGVKNNQVSPFESEAFKPAFESFFKEIKPLSDGARKQCSKT